MGGYPTGDHSIGDHSPGDYHSRGYHSRGYQSRGYPTRACATGHLRGFRSSMHARQSSPSVAPKARKLGAQHSTVKVESANVSHASIAHPRVLRQGNCKPVKKPNHYHILCTLKCRDHPTALDLETKSSAIKEGRRWSKTFLKEAGNGRKSIENMGRPSASRRSGASSG